MTLLLAVLCGIALLLVLILYVRIQAFPALLLAAITVGLIAGMPPQALLKSIEQGMSGTLGFIAIVVGLGALFGAILEVSGGIQALAARLLQQTGERKAPWALMVTGFLVSIPVFFDVGIVLLAPVVYALHRKTGRPLLLYAIPLLAGLAVTHSFIPPTPGPVAVAEILDAQLGWVIVAGLLAGIPAAVIGGPLFGRYIARRIDTGQLPALQETETATPPPVMLIVALVGLPLVLILSHTFIYSPWGDALPLSANAKGFLALPGHPFIALLIANLLAWYLLGIRRGVTRKRLLEVSTRSLGPAGVIILITGAGGVFKEVLTDTGAGAMLAAVMTGYGLSAPLFAFLTAALVRVLQGSATVAMITSAGMTAAFIDAAAWSDMHKALLVIAVASGATVASHVNDSGFWLVSRYFGLSEVQTLRSWTVLTTLIALTGLGTVLMVWAVLP